MSNKVDFVVHNRFANPGQTESDGLMIFIPVREYHCHHKPIYSISRPKEPEELKELKALKEPKDTRDTRDTKSDGLNLRHPCFLLFSSFLPYSPCKCLRCCGSHRPAQYHSTQPNSIGWTTE
jgi:hypothetical protein